MLKELGKLAPDLAEGCHLTPVPRPLAREAPWSHEGVLQKGWFNSIRGGGDCLIKTPDSANGVSGSIGSDTCPSAGNAEAGGDASGN